MTRPARPPLPPGLVAFVKRDCPTCELVAPVLARIARETALTVYTQDDPGFPPGVDAVDDTSLEVSWHLGIEAVPTLVRVGEDGSEEQRVVGWQREEWEAPTVGIVLCSDKNDAVVKITLPEDNDQIHAARYQLYLPTEEELRTELTRGRERAEHQLRLASETAAGNAEEHR